MNDKFMAFIVEVGRIIYLLRIIMFGPLASFGVSVFYRDWMGVSLCALAFVTLGLIGSLLVAALREVGYPTGHIFPLSPFMPLVRILRRSSL